MWCGPILYTIPLCVPFYTHTKTLSVIIIDLTKKGTILIWFILRLKSRTIFVNAGVTDKHVVTHELYIRKTYYYA